MFFYKKKYLQRKWQIIFTNYDKLHNSATYQVKKLRVMILPSNYYKISIFVEIQGKTKSINMRNTNQEYPV